jgi:hypothetical protein
MSTHGVMRTFGRWSALAGLAGLFSCEPAPVTPQPKPKPTPSVTRSGCDELVVHAIAQAEAASREGLLDRSGRILDAARSACPDPRLSEALAETWLEQGRLREVARLLEAPTPALQSATLASLRQRLAEAEKQPPDADELLWQAREAAARGDTVTARRRYDQVLARLGERETPTLLFLDPATPHFLDRTYAGPASEQDDGALRVWPARNVAGSLGAAVARLREPNRPYRWFDGGAELLGGEVVVAAGAIQKLRAPGGGQPQAMPIRGWSRSPAGDVVLVDTDDAVEQLTFPGLLATGRAYLPGPIRSHTWLDEHRVLVRSDGEEAAALLDLRRPGLAVASVTGRLTAAAEDGSVLARVVGEGGKDVLSAVDSATGRELFRRPVSFADRLHTLTVSPHGKEVVFLPGDGTAVVFAVPSGQRRVVGTPKGPEWDDFTSPAMSDDGWVCAETHFANFNDGCELRAVVNIRGAPAPPPGFEQLCLRDAGGNISAMPVPTKAQSAGRERISSADLAMTDICALAKGPRIVAWLEGRMSRDGGPVLRTDDIVLVIWNLQARRVERTIPLEGVAYESYEQYVRLSIDGDVVRGEVGRHRFVADAAKGTARVESQPPREATVGVRQVLAELSEAGFARSAGGAVIDLGTGAPATAPVGATWSWDPITFRGHRVRIDFSRVIVEDDYGKPVASLTAFATGLSVVTYPHGEYELLGPKPRLGCLFGDRVTELDVCAERYLVSDRYRGLWAR